MMLKIWFEKADAMSLDDNQTSFGKLAGCSDCYF